jgi:hypothetical protein
MDESSGQRTLPESGGIGWAINELHAGNKVQRVRWNDSGQYLALQVPDEHSKMTLPYIYVTTVQSNVNLVPWFASQADILAVDWCRAV